MPASGEEARTTMSDMLQRLDFSEDEAEDIVDFYVERVLVLRQRQDSAAEAGFTLLATFGRGPGWSAKDGPMTPCFGRHEGGYLGVKEWVYKCRHAWRESAISGPELAIGHNLTILQRERQATLFPLQQQVWQQGVPVRMEHFPAVHLVVAGRDCHTTDQVKAAVAAYQKRKGRQQQPKGR